MRFQSQHNRRRLTPHARGFTLVEIIIVVTIIALLAGTAILSLLGTLSSSKTKIAGTKAKAIATALKLYQIEGNLVDDGMDLTVLLLLPDEGGGASGPYVENEEALIDPWKNPYEVRSPGEVNRGSFDIISFGSDGQPGGSGEAQDVTN